MAVERKQAEQETLLAVKDVDSFTPQEDDDIEMAQQGQDDAPGFFQRTKQDMRKRRTTSRRLELLSAVIHCIERQKVPRSCFLAKRDSYLITGLDRVIFGTVSAAQAVKVCGMRPPQYLFYMMSGSICDVLQFAMDFMIHHALGVQDPSVCWACGFCLSIVFRHTSHRYLVFGDYVGGYWNSLLRMYGGYSVIIILSTAFNLVMTKYARFTHYVAWIITLLWTGVVNYFILKKLWSFGGSLSSKAAAGDSDTDNDEGEDSRGR